MTVTFGENIKVELYGTSHGPAVGVRIEGIPAGRIIDLEKLQVFLNRRAPGRNPWSTSRKEADRPVFLSGVQRPAAGDEHQQAGRDKIGSETEGEKHSDGGFLMTDGEPLIAEIRNTNIRPKDYQNVKLIPRPAHADYPAFAKYGKIESGGGVFSARLTAALCVAGGIFLQWLEDAGISISAHIRSIGFIEDVPFDPVAGELFVVDEEFPVMDQRQAEAMKELIAEVKAAGDSIGGSIECMICGLPAGAGEPLFGNIESRICQTVFAVPAVKGIEFGDGFDVARMKGSENNDPFILLREDPNDEASPASVRTLTNHHGGILGGLASGMPILFRVAMKPTPSIAVMQRSVDLVKMEEAQLQIQGRHDPCIVPRAVPCIEAAAALAIGDICFAEGVIWSTTHHLD